MFEILVPKDIYLSSSVPTGAQATMFFFEKMILLRTPISQVIFFSQRIFFFGDKGQFGNCIAIIVTSFWGRSFCRV